MPAMAAIRFGGLDKAHDDARCQRPCAVRGSSAGCDRDAIEGEAGRSSQPSREFAAVHVGKAEFHDEHVRRGPGGAGNGPGPASGNGGVMPVQLEQQGQRFGAVLCGSEIRIDRGARRRHCGIHRRRVRPDGTGVGARGQPVATVRDKRMVRERSDDIRPIPYYSMEFGFLLHCRTSSVVGTTLQRCTVKSLGGRVGRPEGLMW